MRLEEELLIRRDRPSMISAKYRAREERRRFLKISAGKLRRIEDPEASLCRSVLINNAVRRLQRENRDEKSRNYALSVNFLHDTVKVNDNTSDVNSTIDDTTSNKRLNEDDSTNEMSTKRLKHDNMELHDVFSDIYILPPTSRMLSHIDNIVGTSESSSNILYHNERSFPEYNADELEISSTNESLYNMEESSSRTAIDLALLKAHDHIDLEETTILANRLFGDDTDRLLYSSVEERISTAMEDYNRIANTASNSKSLETFPSLEDHHRPDRSKIDHLSNNQSCGRHFHDIQTFHSLVPGLES